MLDDRTEPKRWGVVGKYQVFCDVRKGSSSTGVNPVVEADSDYLTAKLAEAKLGRS